MSKFSANDKNMCLTLLILTEENIVHRDCDVMNVLCSYWITYQWET